MSVCRGCGAEIIWIKTKAGKNMPCDPELIDYVSGTMGQTLVTKEGDTINLLDGDEGYAPHWGTCSKAQDFKI